MSDFIMNKEEAEWFERSFGVKVEEVFEIRPSQPIRFIGAQDPNKEYTFKPGVPMEFRKRVYDVISTMIPLYDKDLDDANNIIAHGIAHKVTYPTRVVERRYVTPK